MAVNKPNIIVGVGAKELVSKWGSFRKRWLTPIPWWLPAIALIVIVLTGLAYTRGWLFAARVNGQFINRLDLISRLEQTYGQNTLENLIVEKLIGQEAVRKGVKVSSDELKQKIDEITKQVPDGDLDKALALQGMTRTQFDQQIKLNLLVEKLVEPNISVTEGEIDEYIKQNKASLDMKATDLREQVKQQLKQNKLYDEAGKLVKSLQDSAKIQKFI